MIDPLRAAVERELGRFGVNVAMAPIVDAWAEAVGPEIARNAWPARLGRDGSLRVHTADSVWAFELGTRAEEIRARLGDAAPARIVFAPGPLPEPTAEDDEAGVREGVRPAARHHEQAASLARGIHDENLRKVVAKAIASSLAAAESGRSLC